MYFCTVQQHTEPRAADLNTDGNSSPTETLDNTQHNKPQRHSDLLSCLSGGWSTTALRQKTGRVQPEGLEPLSARERAEGRTGNDCGPMEASQRPEPPVQLLQHSAEGNKKSARINEGISSCHLHSPAPTDCAQLPLCLLLESEK